MPSFIKLSEDVFLNEYSSVIFVGILLPVCTPSNVGSPDAIRYLWFE